MCKELHCIVHKCAMLQNFLAHWAHRNFTINITLNNYLSISWYKSLAINQSFGLSIYPSLLSFYHSNKHNLLFLSIYFLFILVVHIFQLYIYLSILLIMVLNIIYYFCNLFSIYLSIYLDKTFIMVVKPFYRCAIIFCTFSSNNICTMLLEGRAPWHIYFAHVFLH